MVRSRESVTFVIKILQEQEQALFLDFQRQIELNNPYLSVVYFLFLYEVAHFLNHWRQKLMAIILDSQFSGLLVFVISESRNRRAISDALLASQILTDGFRADCSYAMSPLSESIVSGYLLLNKKRHEASRKEKTEVWKVQEEMASRVMELEVERDCCERENTNLKVAMGESSSSIVNEQEQRKVVMEENIQLKNVVYQSKEKMKKMAERIRELEEANVALGQQLETIQKACTNSSIREAGIRTRITSLSQLEAAYEKAQDELQKQEATIKGLRDGAQKDRRRIEALNQKVAKFRQRAAELTSHRADVSELMVQSEQDKAKAASQYEKMDARIQTLLQEKRRLEESGQQAHDRAERLKAELDQTKRERNEFQQKSVAKYKTAGELEERILRLEDRNNEYQMLFKLIHKTTSRNQAKVPAAITTFLKAT
jgi:chromosome segregation ATPase